MAKESAKKGTGNSALDAVIGQIRKQFGDMSIMRLGDHDTEKIPVISTGALSLDMALGVGGLPRGRIVECYGHESSGKTTLALHVVANAQKAGGMAAFIDAEHALDPQYAAKIGVNLDDLIVAQPNSGEEALTICEELVKSGQLDVVVVDSVAALTPQAEIDGAMGDSHVGLQARLMSQAMRKLTSIINQTKTLLIFTNQQLCHQVDDVAGGEVCSGMFVVTLRELSHQFFEDIAHIHRTYLVCTQIGFLCAEFLDDQIE